jgi:putative endonuclease
MAPKAQKIVRPNPRGQVGRHGEALAADFLENQGFQVIARNWSCRLGEIDLIVGREQELRFVEVKTRSGTSFGYPEEAISATKRQKWLRTMELWLQIHTPQSTHYQADVISILLRGDEPEVTWIQNIELG